MAESNANARLEALSDGVFAIAMTLLVIEIRPPTVESIHATADLWQVLAHALPKISAFVLSFTIIFITWVNHHGTIRIVPRTCASFLFANGLLLFSVAFLPFPTALLGEFVLTDHGAPAVVLYNAVLVVQAISWILLTQSAIANGLSRDAQGEAFLRMNHRSGLAAMVLYGALAVLALWLPLPVAILTTATWAAWLVMGLRAKHV